MGCEPLEQSVGVQVEGRVAGQGGACCCDYVGWHVGSGMNALMFDLCGLFIVAGRRAKRRRALCTRSKT